MELHDFILKHVELPYNPIKRHEYYLKTRQLKGRNKNINISLPSKSVSSIKQNLVKRSFNNKEEIQKRRDKVDVRIKVLNEKLDKLRGILKDLKQQSDDNKKSENNKEQTPVKRKELTAAEKKEAAKEAQKSREKEMETSPDQKLKEVLQKIAAVQKQIKEAREKLHKDNVKKFSFQKPKV